MKDTHEARTIRSAALPPPIPTAATRRRPSIPPPIPPRALRGSRDLSVRSVDDGSIDVDVDLTPSFEKVAPLALASVEIAPDLFARDDATPLPRPYIEDDDELFFNVVHTQHERTSNIRQGLATFRLVKLGIAAVLAGGLSAMAVIMLRGDDKATPVQSMSVEPLAQPAIEPLAPPAQQQQPAAPAPVVTSAPLRQLTVTSQPAGATITIVDDGVASVVGETPLSVSIEPERDFDIVLTLAGHRTQLTHLDRHAHELAIALAPSQDTSSGQTRKRVAAAPQATTATSGEGILMVSTKPPCEIAIDGVATMLTTPQRAIKLRTGKHKVTLFNLSRNIDETFEVVVSAHKPTKLIRDFMPAQ
jgi:hypothetical protein